MASTDKSLTVSIKGDSTQLGASTRQAVSSLNEVKGAADSMLASFTGGIIGGGIVGVVSTVVSMVAKQINDAQQLLRDARSSDLDTRFLKGARFFAARINAPENTVESAIANARQARSDAQAGDPDAIANFERLGITLKEIRDLAPDQLFDRIADVFKDGDLSRMRLAGGAGILGRAQAQALIPYMAGGDQGRINLSSEFRGIYSDPFFSNSAIYANGINGIVGSGIEGVLAGNGYKRNIEPITTFGVGDEQKAARMAAETRQQLLGVLRGELVIENQIKEARKEQAALIKSAEAETDSTKRERIFKSAAEIEGQIAGLYKERDKAASVPALKNVQSDVDDFARRGLFIGGGRGESIQAQQLKRLESIEAELKKTRDENVKYWG